MHTIVTAKGSAGSSGFDIGAPDELEGIIIYLLSIFPSNVSCHGARAKWWSGSGLNFLYAMLRLFGAFPHRGSVSSRGRFRIGQGEFVPGKIENSFLIGSPPVWECTALNVRVECMICLAYRVRAEVGKAPLRGCLVFFWSSCLAIVGREFRNIRTNKHYGKVAIWFKNCLALRIRTKIIGFLAVLCSVPFQSGSELVVVSRRIFRTTS